MSRVHLKRAIIARILISFTLFLLAITATVLYNFRGFTVTNVKERSTAIGELVLAGLTAHMRNNTMDERGYYLAEIAKMQGVADLWVVRSEAIDQQFGSSVADQFERAADKTDRAVFADAQNRFEMDEFGRGVARVSIPYIAKSDGALNCLACHFVPEGTVLGILNVETPIEHPRRQALLYGALVASLVLLFVGVMVVGSVRLTERFVIRPLHKLVDLVEAATRAKKPIRPEVFRTLDFAAAAEQFNRILSEVNEKTEAMERLNSEIEATLRETIFTLASIGERKCEQTGNHVRRVQLYCEKLALMIGLDEKQAELIKTASALHDIGKVAIPDEILKKPGSLSDEEYRIVKEHAQLGHEMLKHSNRDVVKAAAIIASEHHEHFDGNGYPCGLTGEAIHIFGRIAAIADVFDALASERYYKKAWTPDEIREFFEKERGKQFDPALTDVFLAHFDEFVAIRRSYQDNHHHKDN